MAVEWKDGAPPCEVHDNDRLSTLRVVVVDMENYEDDFAGIIHDEG